MNLSGLIRVWKASLLRFPFRIGLVLIAVTAFGHAGCSTLQFATLREKPRNPLSERLRLSDPVGPRPSARTANHLAASGAIQTRDIGSLLHQARRSLRHTATGESLHAVAELSYLVARQTESQDVGLAEELYLDAAQYAWRYLVGIHDQ